MPIFKTTNDILNNPWANDADFCVDELPIKEEWIVDTPATFDDIQVWEQIYNQPGNIGVYAAWSPYVEIYIIVYNLFVKSPYGIEVFLGANASEQIIEKMQELDVDLTTNYVWIN